MTPFLGNGGSVLSLPGGYPAATTGAMPLATTLQSVDLGFKRTRYDLGASMLNGENWSYRVDLRRDVRDGTQRTSGSFYTNGTHLVNPVDQTTDQLELSTSYTSRVWQATLAYHASLYRAGPEALTWTNAFLSAPIGNTSGQLAQAPSNQFHQIVASAGYEISPTVRASAEIAFGRMTQDAAYLAATTNTSLVVPPLPAQSLQGRADTLNASLRLSAAVDERLRLNASYVHDERDNQTPIASYPSVSTDMFVGSPRNNQAYSFTQDKFRLSADYRGPGSMKTSVGADHDTRKRPEQEAETTREATLWGRVGFQPDEKVTVALRGAHAQRTASDYVSVGSIVPPENPLLRKYNMADRERDSVGLRADFAATENVSIGLGADVAYDDYTNSTIGLLDGRTASFGGDVSFALSDATRLNFYAQAERIESRQAGSEVFAQPDWKGKNEDAIDLVGFGLKHAAMNGKLEIGADLVFSRSRSDVTVETAASNPGFPQASTSLDMFKLRATYRLSENMSLTGLYWYERYTSADWMYDGVLPATIPNLLAFGEQPPHYTVNVVQVALRYRF
jgi:MtrB/PioB family decaheme-associated outer membrane protein